MKVSLLVVLIAAVSASAFLFSLDNGTSFKSEVDWQKGSVRIDIETDTGEATSLSPKMRFDTEKRIEQMMPAIFLSAVSAINVDSLITVGESIAQQKVVLDKIGALSESGDKINGYISQDYKKIHIKFSYSFFGEGGLVSCFTFHSKPVRIERALGFTDAGRFTGLVIYAKGTYELMAKNTEGRLSRALFPAIYDEQMNLILVREMCNPEALKKWGMVLYTDSTDDKQFSERVGAAPLHIMAAGLFGTHNTDIIIPKEDAVKLLSSVESRKILSEGRILIITD